MSAQLTHIGQQKDKIQCDFTSCNAPFHVLGILEVRYHGIRYTAVFVPVPTNLIVLLLI